MILLLYSLGYVFLLITCLRLRHLRSVSDKLLLMNVVLVPIGKLAYLNVPSAPGLKFGFIFLCASLLWVTANALFRVKSVSLNCIAPFVFMIPAILSLVALHNPSMLISYEIDDQRESVIARLVSLLILIAFACWTAVSVSTNRRKFTMIVKHYVGALLFSTLVGFIVFIGVFFGKLGLTELTPISADTHIVGNFYRFNPGSNVNEFGMLLGYGIFFALWLEWRTKKKVVFVSLLLIAELLTLTRASWIGVICGFVCWILMSGKKRWTYVVPLVLVTVAVFSAAALNQDFKDIMVSSTALDLGSSGEDRLEKYQFVLDGL